MAPIIASSLIGAGSSILSKGLNALFDRVGRKDGEDGAQNKFGITGQNMPGTGSKDPTSAVQDLFKAMDSNSDGSVTHDELKSFVAQQRQAIQAQLIQIQADHSGRTHPGRGEGGAKGDRIFSKIDTDGDGKLSSDELSSYLKAMAQRLREAPGTSTTGTAAAPESTTTATA